MQLQSSYLNPEEKLKDTFISLTTNLSTLLAEAGTHVAAFSTDLPHFSKLDFHQKTAVLSDLLSYYDLCAEHVGEKQTLRDSKKFTWRAMTKMGLAPVSNLLDGIEDGDIVEIYNRDNIQIFRNLEFFDFCSYNLEELYCREWWRLFHRDPRINDQIMNILEGFDQRRHREGLWNAIPPHVVHEIASVDRGEVEVQIKYIGPLYQNRQVQAVLAIEQAVFI